MGGLSTGLPWSPDGLTPLRRLTVDGLAATSKVARDPVQLSGAGGDQIRIGQVIGAVGSTGRSTGPHLHYETRIDGDAVDPQKFLRAGVRLSAG